MVSLNFVLYLGAAICFGIVFVIEVVRGWNARPGFGWAIPLGLLLWLLPALLAVWP